MLLILLQKMSELMDSLDELQQRLTDIEREKSKWPPVADVIVENLPDEIDTCKVNSV